MLTAAIIIVIIILFLLIPIGIKADYNADGLSVFVRVFAADIRILPKNKAAAKGDKKKKNKKQKKFKLEFSFEEWKQIAKIVLKALGKFKRSICCDRIKLNFVSADTDPYNAVYRYNLVNAALCSAEPLFDKAFKVKKRDICVSTDYDSEKNFFEAGITLSVRAGQALFILITAAFAFGKVYFISRRNKRLERKDTSGE